LTVKRSEFYRLTSTSVTDLQNIDLQGSNQVILKFDTAVAGQEGALQNSQAPNEVNYMLLQKDDPALIIVSNDGYLYFRSLGAYDTFLYVWVVR